MSQVVVVYIMAACMNMNRCSLSKIPIRHLILFVFLSLSSFSPALTATTTPPAGTTSASTATTTPATTTQVQTTTITPQSTPSPVPANTDIGTCPCDLTGNACDVNCCCDTDCSTDERKAFSECLPFSFSIDSRLCLQQEVILTENSPYFSNITSDNLFCIYFDNRAERNFYNNPDLVQTNAIFNKYVQDYGSFSFQPEGSRTPTVYQDFYKSGVPIYTVFESQAQGTLGLPKSLSSTFCADSNPAAFLVEESHDCVRPLTSLATECITLPALNGNTYYQGFRVVTTPALFQRYTPLNTSVSNDTSTTGAAVDLSVVTDVYNNTYTVEVQPIVCQEVARVVSPCNATTPPAPQWDGTTCNNVVTGVTYNIQHNGTGGIISVSVRLILSSVAGTTQRLTQSYASSFRSINDPNIPYQRSGNPGYVQGQPVIAGILNQTEDANGRIKTILLNGDRNQWLTLVRASPGGDCMMDINRNRVSVKFKDDVRSGCFIQMSLTNFSNNCQRIQETINNALEGDTSPNRYVAIFGNSDVNKVGDWTPILVQNRPNPSSAADTSNSRPYCYLSVGMHIQVLYAYVGALVNPQPKIIGISFLYDSPQNVYFRCEGPYCQPSALDLTQKIEISTSVSFIDVSQPAVGYEAERPIFLAKVPYDFFYPFLDNASTRTKGEATLLLCCCVSVVLKLIMVKT